VAGVEAEAINSNQLALLTLEQKISIIRIMSFMLSTLQPQELDRDLWGRDVEREYWM
jgi:hypothetical protein